MSNFRELIETIHCKKLKTFFNFQGDYEKNKKGLNISSTLLNTNCDDLSELKECLEDIHHGFWKNDNYTKMNIASKDEMSSKLSVLLDLLNDELIIKKCI